MIKTFENFNELDPYNEEDWNDDLIVKDDTIIDIGDRVYDWNNMYCGEIVNKVDNHYLLDNGKIAEKWQLILHKFRIKKKNE